MSKPSELRTARGESSHNGTTAVGFPEKPANLFPLSRYTENRVQMSGRNGRRPIHSTRRTDGA